MTDIVERLRSCASDDHERGCQGRCYDCSCGYDAKRDPLLNEAADTIERLRAALEPFASLAYRYDPVEADDDDWVWDQSALPTISDLRRARAALGGDK